MLTKDDGENFSTCLHQLRLACSGPWKWIPVPETSPAWGGRNLSPYQQLYLPQGHSRKMLPGHWSPVPRLWSLVPCSLSVAPNREMLTRRIEFSNESLACSMPNVSHSLDWQLSFIHFLDSYSVSFSYWNISNDLSSGSLILSSALTCLLLNASSVLLLFIYFSVQLFYFLSPMICLELFNIFCLLKFSVSLCIMLLASVNISMMLILNSLSGKIYILVLLESISTDLSCSSLWNIFLCLFIFCASLVSVH